MDQPERAEMIELTIQPVYIGNASEIAKYLEINA
jgi:hypothetical protein